MVTKLNLHFKIQFNDDKFYDQPLKVLDRDNLTYQEFCSILVNVCSLTEGSITGLTYIDEDNDEVAVGSNEEFYQLLKSARKMVKSNQCCVVNVTLKDTNSGNEFENIEATGSDITNEESVQMEVLNKMNEMNQKLKPLLRAQTEPPVWFKQYMTQFKGEILQEVKGIIHKQQHGLEKPIKFKTKHCPEDVNIKTDIHCKIEKFTRKERKIQQKMSRKHDLAKLLKLNVKLRDINHAKNQLISSLSETEKQMWKESVQGNSKVHRFDAKEIVDNQQPCITVKPGATFEFTWTILNCGQQAWTEDTQLNLMSCSQGFQPLFNVVQCPPLESNDIGQICMEFTAPRSSGSYSSIWKLTHAGYQFGQCLTCMIVVDSEGRERQTARSVKEDISSEDDESSCDDQSEDFEVIPYTQVKAYTHSICSDGSIEILTANDDTPRKTNEFSINGPGVYRNTDGAIIYSGPSSDPTSLYPNVEEMKQQKKMDERHSEEKQEISSESSVDSQCVNQIKNPKEGDLTNSKRNTQDPFYTLTMSAVNLPKNSLIIVDEQGHCIVSPKDKLETNAAVNDTNKNDIAWNGGKERQDAEQLEDLQAILTKLKQGLPSSSSEVAEFSMTASQDVRRAADQAETSSQTTSQANTTHAATNTTNATQETSHVYTNTPNATQPPHVLNINDIVQLCTVQAATTAQTMISNILAQHNTHPHDIANIASQAANNVLGGFMSMSGTSETNAQANTQTDNTASARNLSDFMTNVQATVQNALTNPPPSTMYTQYPQARNDNGTRNMFEINPHGNPIFTNYPQARDNKRVNSQRTFTNNYKQKSKTHTESHTNRDHATNWTTQLSSSMISSDNSDSGHLSNNSKNKKKAARKSIKLDRTQRKITPRKKEQTPSGIDPSVWVDLSKRVENLSTSRSNESTEAKPNNIWSLRPDVKSNTSKASLSTFLNPAPFSNFPPVPADDVEKTSTASSTFSTENSANINTASENSAGASAAKTPTASRNSASNNSASHNSASSADKQTASNIQSMPNISEMMKLLFEQGYLNQEENKKTLEECGYNVDAAIHKLAALYNPLPHQMAQIDRNSQAAQINRNNQAVHVNQDNQTTRTQNQNRPPRRSPPLNLDEMMSHMIDMGFDNIQENLTMLTKHSFQLEDAVIALVTAREEKENNLLREGRPNCTGH